VSATQINEGAYRISGRFGEGFYLDPSGVRPPLKIVEATQIEFTLSLAVTDVPLSGNRTGSKDGPESRTGVMALNQIDAFFENIVFDARAGNLDARRAARDAGHRVARTFTLQVWQDDPEALGALGYQLDGVRISDLTGGFNFGDDITARQYNYRYEDVSRIRSFERLGNQIDPSTGLPAIRYLAPDNSGG
jgi:hypothetical protein